MSLLKSSAAAAWAAGLVLLSGCSAPFDAGELVWDLSQEAAFASWSPEEVPSAAQNRAPDDAPMLSIRAGQRIDFYLRVPNGSRFAIARCEQPRSTKDGLTVLFQRQGGREAEVASLDTVSRGKSFSLPDGESEIARLSFVAPPASGSDAPSKPQVTTLHAPQVRAEIAPRDASRDTESSTTASGRQPDIFIYLVDTLRADRLGVYGSERPTSPHLDELAREALVFSNAFAQSSWTKPSIASIFTGLDAEAHRVLDNDSILPDALFTLAEALSLNGYATAGLQTNHIVGEKFNFGQGFDRYIKAGHKVNALAEKILEDRDTSRPMFMYVHTIRPHNPYRPDEEFKERFAPGVPIEYGETEFLKALRYKRAEPEIEKGVAELYEGEVAFNDHHFGEFLELLRRFHVYEDSVVLFLSDHGEELWDHGGWGHGHTLYREVTKVPFVLKEPAESRTGVVDVPVQLIDVFPTILDYAGIEDPAGLMGSSVRRFADLQRSRAAVATVERHGNIPERPMSSIQDDRWKLIVTSSPDGHGAIELFDIAADPLESVDVSDKNPIAAAFLQVQLKRHQLLTEALAASESANMDDETVEQLRALGYVN